MMWLRQTWSARAVRLGLLIHFCLWWALSAWFWISGYGWTLAPLAAPLAPILMGVFYLQPRGLWPVGLAGILVFAALVLLTWFSLTKRKRWIVLLAHFTIVAYWVMSFGLIAAGV